MSKPKASYPCDAWRVPFTAVAFKTVNEAPQGYHPKLRDIVLYRTERRIDGRRYFISSDLSCSRTWMRYRNAMAFQRSATVLLR